MSALNNLYLEAKRIHTCSRHGKVEGSKSRGRKNLKLKSCFLTSNHFPFQRDAGLYIMGIDTKISQSPEPPMYANSTGHKPLYLCQQGVHVMAAFLPRLKDGLTLVKEQDGIVDLGLTEYELEVLPCSHAPQGREVDQKNLCTPNKWVTQSRREVWPTFLPSLLARALAIMVFPVPGEPWKSITIPAP